MQSPFQLQSARARRWLITLSLFLLGGEGLPMLWGLGYSDQAALTAQLKKVAADHPQIVHLERAATTSGQRELWLVELGTGQEAERKSRPAMLVVAGIEGNDLVGTVSVVHWVEHLAERYDQDEAIRRLLESTTLYVFPRVNPDAVESFFARPKVERTGNNTPVDADHDGLLDEDGPEDLDGDGLVTWLRVEDPEGEYILDPVDPRVLIKASKAKGEKGAWKLFTEGIDNDKDERWNEDGPGGVNLNRNFPRNYKFFAADSGRHPVSEVETRALADFIVAHPNIGIAFTFGAADNLVQTPKSEPGGKRPPTALSEADASYFEELGRVYRDSVGLKKELAGASEPGTLSDWIYFHRGRLSLAARPWIPELQMELARKAKTDADKNVDKKESASIQDDSNRPGADPEKKPGPATPSAKDKSTPAEKRGEDERAMLKWFDQNAPEGFVAWKEFRHPDFPDQKAEIGGWAPFARSNPPARLLEEWAERHAKFLTLLAGKLPRVGVRKAEATPLGSGVYEVKVQIENTGYLPTALAQGALTREVLRTRVLLKLDGNRILAGQKMTLLGPIDGSGGMQEIRYVIRPEGPLEIEVISALGGSVRRTIELKEAP